VNVEVEVMQRERDRATSRKGNLCLTVKQMAEELGIGINTAYQLIHSDGFPVIRFGERQIRIPKAGLEKWLLKQVEAE